ncbi:hypothetical protein H4Q26_004953 [Puccinia striiformis f. sp. tritici PST-130]|nr:hypothetical protein H4Q26_004953 [Puccinia striiformis f. sp. tritici PST-130]
MLKGSGRQDALIPARPGKSPVLISDLAELFRTLSGRGPEAEAVKDLAVVAFWGMARRAEFPEHDNHQRTRSQNGQARRSPGHQAQINKFPTLPSRAIERRQQATTSDTDSLFGYEGPKGRINLSKRHANQVLAAAWHDLGRPHLMCHSFRVGGATLQHAVGININEIKSLGRWTTDCYKRYVKPLSREEVITSLSILELQSFSNST